MENREYLNKLFDIYKELLTDVEQVTFINYYQEDLTLSEIAENRGISKSSVSKTLNGAVDKLKIYEDVLHNYKLKGELNELFNLYDINILKERLSKIIDK